MRPVLIGLIAVASLATGATAKGAGTQLTLADTGAPGSRLTAELAAQALAAQGFTVTRTTTAGAAAADAAVRAGTLDAYATDGATLLERVLGRPKERTADRLPALLQAVLATRAQTLVAIGTDDDSPRVACTRAAVRAHKLTGLASLPKAAPKLTYAVTAAHVVRADGFAALRAAFRRVIVSPGAGRFDVIARRRAHCVLSSGTEPQAARLSLVALRDAQRRLSGTPAHAVLVASQAYVASAPATFAATVGSVAGTQTPAGMLGMRSRVEVGGEDIAVVAAEHLRGAGLVP